MRPIVGSERLPRGWHNLRSILPHVAIRRFGRGNTTNDSLNRPTAATKWRDALCRVRSRGERGHDGAWPFRSHYNMRARCTHDTP